MIVFDPTDWPARLLLWLARRRYPDKLLIVCEQDDIEGLVHAQVYVERLRRENVDLKFRLSEAEAEGSGFRVWFRVQGNAKLETRNSKPPSNPKLETSSLACPACGRGCAAILNPPKASPEGVAVANVCSHCGHLLVSLVTVAAVRAASEAEVRQFLHEFPQAGCLQKKVRCRPSPNPCHLTPAFELSEKDLDQIQRARRAGL